MGLFWDNIFALGAYFSLRSLYELLIIKNIYEV